VTRPSTSSRIATAIRTSRGAVGAENGIVEERDDRIAGEPLQRGPEIEHQGPERRVIVAEHRHHLPGLGDLRERSEAAEVAEDRGDLAAIALEEPLAVIRYDIGELRREEAPEPLEPRPLLVLRGHPRDEGSRPVGSANCCACPST